ncbi:thiamine phosphate synthase [Kiritimatiella glycovorans]|uniref:Thiamine-phosphate synthase n=1 Tax=Kiritimatiella glycovorans TaxID=1307763 RepID=A0A0G3EJK4_9BACT|nr:thiamine phosphate synthase [Kiritimatiella glycovorans]AKJ64975.1 Thiamine-phosphate synthase [Kiritimatiella glycovorans]
MTARGGFSEGLYLILTEPVAGYEACAEAAVAREVPWLQYRPVRECAEGRLACARRLRRITRNSATRFIVNDDVELARECAADGVHLGQDDMDPERARRLWPDPGAWMGISTHNARQVRDAEMRGADYIGVGPVFPTRTKVVRDPVLGVAGAAELIRASALPCVAIGGMDAASVPRICAAGIRTFAVIGAVCNARDPGAAIDGLTAAACG